MAVDDDQRGDDGMSRLDDADKGVVSDEKDDEVER